MFYNYNRTNGFYDSKKCNCPKCRERNNWEDEEKDYDYDEYDNQCSFPVDVCLTVKEGKQDCHKGQGRYDRNYDNDNTHYDNFDYEECYGKKDDKKECCFPIDVCFTIKEGKRKAHKEDDCHYKKDKDDRWDNDNKKDNCHGQNNNRPTYNNCHRNNCCYLGLLGCLCRNFRRY